MLANVYHTEDNDRSCRRSGENGTTVGTVLKRTERIGTSVTFLAVVVRAPPVSWGSQSEGPVHRGRAGQAWQNEPQAVGHTASVVRKQRTVKADVLLPSS